VLRDPVKVAVTPSASTVDSVIQRVLHVESHSKRALLVELFADPQMSRTLVFTRTKRGADRVARHLEAAGIRVAAIHGNKSQPQREQALAAFRASKIRVLVATDIAARGIDIDQVTHVVNYELPEVPEATSTASVARRAGAAGIAISLCDVDERDLLRGIERLTRQSIPAEDRRSHTSKPPERAAHREPARRNGNGNGRRQHQQHGEKTRATARSWSSGPARYGTARKQGAGRTGSL
jgi:ATP-dependent RNA helicase RhlE